MVFQPQICMMRGAAITAIRNNFLEHENYPRGEFMDYYKPDVAQVLFDCAWQEAEGMLAAFISQRFAPNVKLRIIPDTPQGVAAAKN